MSTHEAISIPELVDVASPSPLPLETGDILTRDEFERRYEAMPELKKAELIEGVVYVNSAVRWQKHGFPHSDLITWMGMYRAHTPGVQTGDNCSIRLDLDNQPQPDATMIIHPFYGGRVQLGDDDVVVGTPELIAEVSASSAGIDLNQKLRVYRRNQVREYIVWRVLDKEVDWFVLRNSTFESLPLGADGIYRSEVFPGLWLDAAALLKFDLRRVWGVLQQGLASPEHAAFADRLLEAAKGRQERG
jgi:Uma2 family endonuclease